MSTPQSPKTSDQTKLGEAIALAAQAHLGVMDKSGQPYILHPLRVMFRCETDIERIVAVLHDVVEDTGRTFDDLRKLGYSEEVIAALDCVTKHEGENYEDFVRRAAANPIARNVKIADIEDNMDMRRLPSLTQRDWDRTAKYLAAWRRLKGLALSE
jgi:(p)ppGpp synthase/HD superfamily hydrolase